MQLSNIVQSPTPHTSSSAMQFKDGQLIFGKVAKLFNNQTAEINIGQTKIIAALDAPITAGERYWFQVQTSGETTTLKVLPSKGGMESLKALSQQLLTHLGLPQTKENATLSQFFVKNQFPITKEQFLQALQWVKSSSSTSDGLNALKIMHNLSLPFSSTVFNAISNFDNGVPLHVQIKNLQVLLQNGSSSTEIALHSLLKQLISTEVERAADNGLNKLLTNWLNSNGNQKEMLFNILKDFNAFPKNIDQEQALLQAFKTATDKIGIEINPKFKEVMQHLMNMIDRSASQKVFNESVRNLLLLINDGMKTNVNKAENTLWQVLHREWAQVAQSQNSDGTSIQTKSAIANSMGHLLSFVGSTKDNSVLQLFSTDAQSRQNLANAQQNVALFLRQISSGQTIGSGDTAFLKQLLNEEIALMNSSKSPLLSDDIRTVIRALGLGFEHSLHHMDKGSVINATDLQALKPLLLKFLYETSMPQAKDIAEQLLHKITAQQLLSQNTGHVQHFITQFPFSFGTFQTEITMQWSGRKKADGEIDPAFCRVIFYLDMENMKETIIDLVVQNRIMKLTIYNEHATSLKDISRAFIPVVKDSLAELGYQVSAVTFQEPGIKQEKNKVNKMYEPSTYYGVDLKI